MTYAAVGKMVMKFRPDIVRELIPLKPTPQEDDLSKLTAYFNRFYGHFGMVASENTGPLYKTHKIDKRRVFVASMAVIYGQDKRLFASEISRVLGQDKSTTTRMIRDVMFNYEKVPDFKSEVSYAVKILMP